MALEGIEPLREIMHAFLTPREVAEKVCPLSYDDAAKMLTAWKLNMVDTWRLYLADAIPKQLQALADCQPVRSGSGVVITLQEDPVLPPPDSLWQCTAIVTPAIKQE